MHDFLAHTLEISPTCCIFSVRHTKEVICRVGHGHFVLKQDRFGHYYWKTDWNGFGNL
jgi:hypothetical protein